MFIVSYFLKEIACKVMSVLLHTLLFLSFSYSVLFGQKVSLMMWQLKNNFASMSEENKEDKTSIVEVSVHIFIILLSSRGGCVPLFYDHVAKNPVFVLVWETSAL